MALKKNLYQMKQPTESGSNVLYCYVGGGKKANNIYEWQKTVKKQNKNSQCFNLGFWT